MSMSSICPRGFARLASALWMCAATAAAQEPAVAPPPRSTDLVPLRRVFVPVDQLDAIVERDQRGVILPKDEFLKLYAAARRHRASTPRSPADAVISGVEYRAELADLQLRLAVRVRFTQFGDAWQSIPLPLRGLSVERAVLGNAPAQIGRHPAEPDTLVLLHDRAGSHVLELELSAPLAALGSDKAAAFGLVPAGAASLALSLPARKQLLVDGLLLERPAPLEEPADYVVPVGGRRDIRLTVTERGAAQAADGLVFAATGFGLDVSPGEITWHAATSVQVFGQSLDRLVFSVPGTLEIADVQASGLESWELADDQDDRSRTSLTLIFRQPFDGSRRILFRGVTTDEDGAWSVPNLILKQATSHVGQVLVQHPFGVRLELADSHGVRPAAVDALSTAKDVLVPFEPRQALLFDVWQERFRLEFVTRTRERQLLADLLTSLEVTERGLDLGTIAKLRTLYAPLFDVQATLPVDWIITAVLINGQPAEWQTLPLEAGVHQVRVELPEPLTPGGQIEVTFSAHRDLENWPLETDAAEFALPEVQLPQAGVTDGAYVLKADADLELTPIEITGLDPAALGLPNERAGYRYQDTRFSGQLRVARKPPRISAQTAAYSRLDPQALRTRLEIMLSVQNSGIRRVEISLPEAVGPNVRFMLVGSMARIVEQTAGEPENGLRAWSLRFDRRVQGEIPLVVELESPRRGGIEFALHAATVVGADRQNGYIAIEAGPQQRLAVQAVDHQNQPLAEVDPVDLPATTYVPKERIVAAYRYVAPGYAVRLSEEKFDARPVPTAVCYQSILTSVLGENAEFQHRAAFTLSAVGVQNLRLVLPEDARLWAVTLDDQPLEVRRDQQSYLLPWIDAPIAAPLSGASVPPQSDPRQPAAGSRTLVVFYRTQVKPLDSFNRIHQEPPQLSAVSGRGDEQPLEVLDQQWAVHYPPSASLIDSDGRFQPQAELDRPSILSRLQESFRVGSPDELMWNTAYIAAAIVVIAVVTLGYRRFGKWGIFPVAGVFGLLAAFSLVLNFLAQERRDAGYSVGDIPPAAKTAPWAGEGFAGGGFGGVMAPEESGAFEGVDEPMQAPTAEAAPPTAQEPARDESESPADTRPAAGPQRAVTGSAPGQAEQELRDRVPDTPAAFPRFQRLKLSGARLSVPVDFQLPPDFRGQQFRTLGAGGVEERAALDVGFEGRQAAGVFRAILLTGVLFGFWWLRSQPWSIRGVIAAAGLAVPLALVTLVPVSWHVVLDGLFLGSAGGVVLWCAIGLCGWLEHCCEFCRRCCRPRSAAGIALLALAFGAGRVGSAQDAQAPRESRNGASLSVTVPYEIGTDPLAADRVFLPYDEFLKLWNDAYPDRRIKRPAGLEGLIAGAAYAAELVPAEKARDARIRVTGRIVAVSFRDHQVKLQLPLGQVSLNSVQLNGQEAALFSGEGGEGAGLFVLLEKPGTRVLDVQFDVPAELQGPAGQFELPLAPVPAGRLTFALPVPDVSVRVSGAGLLPAAQAPDDRTAEIGIRPGSEIPFRRRTENGRQFVEAAVDRGGRIRVSWRPEEMRGVTEDLVQAEAVHALDIGDDGIHLRSRLDFRVRQGKLTELGFGLPADLRLQRISGPDVGGWELAGSGEARTLRVFLRREVADATWIEFELYLAGEFHADATEVPFPALAPRNVTRETGTVGVFAGEQFAVQAGDVRNAAQINSDMFAQPAEWKRQRPLLTFRYVSRPVEIPLLVSRRQTETRVTAQHGVRVGLRKMHVTSRWIFDVKGAGQARLVLLLPEHFLPLSTEATHLAEWYVSGEQGEKSLIVELDAPRSGRLEVVVSGTVPKGISDDAVEVLLPLPLHADDLQSLLAVWVEDVYRPSLAEAEGWRSVPAEQLPPDLRALESRLPDFALRSTNPEPFGVTLNLLRAAPRLAADSVVVVTLGDSAVHYTLALGWRIEQAAAQELVFTTPDWLAGRLDFTAADVRQVIEQPRPGGRLRWILRLQQPQREQYFLTATATLPPPDAASGVRAPEVLFEHSTGTAEQPAYAALDVARTRQFVVLVNQSRAQLVPANVPGVERFADELPIKIRQSLLDQAIEILRLSRPDAAPLWQVQHLAPQAAAEASVNLAELVTVVDQDGTWRTQATYRVKNRGRQFLPLKLPEGSHVLSIYVGDRAARAVGRTDLPYQLIPLPKTSQSDLPFLVKVVLSGRLPRTLPEGFRPWAREVDFPAPQVVSKQESADFGIPVARTQWSVYLPENLDAEPLDDSNRHNLSRSTAAETVVQRRMAYLREAAELFTVARGRSSGKSKFEALNNLKQLSIDINSSVDFSSAESSELLRQLQDQQRAFNEQFQHLNERAQIDATKQQAVIVLDDSEALPDVDGESLEAFNRKNAADLYLDNSIRPRGELVPGVAQPAEERFRLKLAAPVPGDPEGRKPGKEVLERKPQSVEEIQDLGRQLEIQQKLNIPALPGQPAPGARPPDPHAPPQLPEPHAPQTAAPGPGGMAAVGGAPSALQQPAAGWTAPGGLSLEIEIPRDGREWTFTKVGGDPKLALALRPRETLETGIGFVWTLVWLTLAGALVYAFRRATDAAVVRRQVPKALAAVGLVLFFLLPPPVQWGGFALFVLGALGIAWQYRHVQQA